MKLRLVCLLLPNLLDYRSQLIFDWQLTNFIRCHRLATCPQGRPWGWSRGPSDSLWWWLATFKPLLGYSWLVLDKIQFNVEIRTMGNWFNDEITGLDGKLCFFNGFTCRTHFSTCRSLIGGRSLQFSLDLLRFDDGCLQFSSILCRRVHSSSSYSLCNRFEWLWLFGNSSLWQLRHVLWGIDFLFTWKDRV